MGVVQRSGLMLCVQALDVDFNAAGTQLVREWGGASHHVLMEEKGRCSYKGKSFASLSAVARHITGAHWSGPRFFGVRS